MDNFYITLPSNASMQQFNNNTKSDYTTLLTNSINLNGNYEIGLASYACTSKLYQNYGSIIIDGLYWQYPFFNVRIPRISLNFDMQPYEQIDKFIEKFNKLFSIKFRNVLVYINTALFADDFLYFKDKHWNTWITKNYESKLQEKIIPLFYYFDTNEPHKFFSPIKYEIRIEGIYDEVKGYYTFTYDQMKKLMLSHNCQFYPMSKKLSATNFKGYAFLNKLENIPNDEILEKKHHDHIMQSEIIFEIKNNLINVKIKNILSEFQISAEGLINEFIFKNGTIRNNSTFNIPNTLSTIKYVAIYCDLIEPQFFGDTTASIIEIIPFDNLRLKNPKIFTYNVNNVHYIPLKKNFINTINISIKDLQGNNIHFSDDFIYTIVKLHIRKIK